MNGAQGKIGGDTPADKIVGFIFAVAGWALVLFIAAIVVIGIGGPLTIALMPDCATEDSDNCHWDGGENGEGDKFVVINGALFKTAL